MPSRPDTENAKKLFDQTEMIAEEQRAIAQARVARLGAADAPTLPWCGLGLSGGGIRSASLALGVLQAFAEHDLLRRFDYLSTVSGGGYLGGSLQWWWYRRPRDDRSGAVQPQFGVGPDDFPYGPARHPTGAESDICQSGRRNLSFLRAHSSYLNAGVGMSNWSMLAVILRTVIISFFTWIFLIALVFALAHFADTKWFEPQTERPLDLWSPVGDFIRGRWEDACRGPECSLRYRVIYAWLMWFSLGLVGLFGLASLVFAFLSRAPQGGINWRSIVMLTIAVGLAGGFVYTARDQFFTADYDSGLWIALVGAVLFIVIGAITVIAEVLTPRSLSASYLLRRIFEAWLGRLFLPFMAVLTAATVPLLPYYVFTSALGAKKSVLAVLFGLVSGLASALYGYYTFIRNIAPGIAGQVGATVGAAIYIYATLIIAYLLAIVSADTAMLTSEFQRSVVPTGFIGCVVVAVLVSLWANINFVGLHRFYRDRLMEAFMPTDASVVAMKAGYSPVADNLSVSDLHAAASATAVAAVPYPLINTNVILTRDHDAKVAARGGDNFLISPLFVGSTATRWRRTSAYADDNVPLTLASAVAASGAAATASAGYIGTGLTMNSLVAAVMSLLNIRLGLWVRNPHETSPLLPRIPTFLHPGLISGIFSRRHSRSSSFIELTDGGHFENLGLYELVRRKLKVIVIVDGEADPTISLRSLFSASRRIEQDFNATIEFESERGPERLVMYPEKGYPSGLKYAQAPFIVGKILYGDNTSGTLIYIKSTLIKDMDFVSSGYLASNPDFPHQSTVDQFFDPDQFDAYRYLGYDSASTVINKLELARTMSDPAQILDVYLNLPDEMQVPLQYGS